MAHFANIDENNIVIEVRIINDIDVAMNGGERSTAAEEWVSNYFGGGTWKQCSWNTNYGKYWIDDTVNGGRKLGPDQSKAYRLNYPGPGYVYDTELDGFIRPKPFDSWVLNTEKGIWNPPVDYPITTTTGVTLTDPNDGVHYEQRYHWWWDEDVQTFLAHVYDENNVRSGPYTWNTSTLEWEL